MSERDRLADLDYEQTEQMIRELPMSWIPALLLLMVRTAYEKKAFIPGRATRFIRDNIPGEEA